MRLRVRPGQTLHRFTRRRIDRHDVAEGPGRVWPQSEDRPIDQHEGGPVRGLRRAASSDSEPQRQQAILGRDAPKRRGSAAAEASCARRAASAQIARTGSPLEISSAREATAAPPRRSTRSRRGPSAARTSSRAPGPAGGDLARARARSSATIPRRGRAAVAAGTSLRVVSAAERVELADDHPRLLRSVPAVDLELDREVERPDPRGARSRRSCRRPRPPRGRRRSRAESASACPPGRAGGPRAGVRRGPAGEGRGCPCRMGRGSRAGGRSPCRFPPGQRPPGRRGARCEPGPRGRSRRRRAR